MGKAIGQLFAFFTTLFTALERSAKIIDNIAMVGEVKSDLFVQEAKHDGAKQQIILDREIAALQLASS